ncbi:3-oxoacyl-ACP synthase III family protein [Aequorivita echinoideorum]|uniref:Ketoacyl-ACP synthase III n=1 Tax=Aequorivita echinoideorum TaxID=1549647 RepID=A0ABS5S2P8_9FLAO|nr:ketoacyl-ACP synthase III [Aequorivita echinoideorum]MBT0607474.1 ketoacyl-ACP synthase III [Aequorivita echinoideorum]
MGVKITGIGSYIPSEIAKNEHFGKHHFYNEDGTRFGHENDVIIEKFKAITGISERRYLPKTLVTSDIASFAAENALKNASLNKEELDYIIVAHNYGDVNYDSVQSDTVPSIATRVKHNLKIEKPTCVAYDVLFGCPGWIEGMIQANAFIKSGIAKKCLVIGAESLSRVVDPHDRDSMIYSDGAGAAIVEKSSEEGGILSHYSATFAFEEAHFIYFGESNNLELKDTRRYIKMYGRKIYEFALSNVPDAMKTCLDQSGISVDEVKMIFIHQANEKMDEAIVNRFYKLYDRTPPKDSMPMSIDKLGNSSVATIPTLYDLVLNNELKGYSVKENDVVIFASVGAGMNINAIVYRI